MKQYQVENKFKPREDIWEYLTVSEQGLSVPQQLHLEKPIYNEETKGLVSAGQQVLIVDLPELIDRLGLSNCQIPMETFLEICEHVLQLHESKNSSSAEGNHLPKENPGLK